MMNYISMVLGAILVPSFSGVRNSLTGRMVSKKSLTQIGALVFNKNDDATFRAMKIEEAQIRGYNVIDCGTHLEFYSMATVAKK